MQIFNKKQLTTLLRHEERESSLRLHYMRGSAGVVTNGAAALAGRTLQGSFENEDGFDSESTVVVRTRGSERRAKSNSAYTVDLFSSRQGRGFWNASVTANQNKFKIELPETLPSSMSVAKVRHVYEIVYVLQAAVMNCSGEVVLQSKPKTFLVMAALSTTDFPSELLRELEVTRVLNKRQVGSILVAAALIPTVAVGRSISVRLACQNLSVTPIQGIEIQVVEQVLWDSCVMQTTIRAHKQDVQLPGLQRDTTRESLSEEAIESAKTNLVAELQHVVNSFVVKLPLATRYTLKGTRLAVRHQLTVTFVTKLLYQNVSFSVDLHVGTDSQAIANHVETDSESDEED